jgi:Periplasmic copper-binding protein (NosD)
MGKTTNRTLRPRLRLSGITLRLAGLLLVTAYDCCWSHASKVEDGKKIITVDNRPDSPSVADYTDIAAALSSLNGNATIHVQEGLYLVDNPIVLNQTGVRIKGQGREKTIIRPRNPGKPIFKFEANDLGVENLGMDAIVANGIGRASFGVYIKEGYAGSEVLNTQIVNTGASAIIGARIRDSKIDGNIISNAGDDGIQERGERLTISNNFIIGYFDEAVDLEGNDIVVINNHARAGRIGITVGGGKNIVIAGNTVEDHVHGAFHISAKRPAIVSHNTVKDSIETAYQLSGIDVIDSNLAEGNNRIGFQINDMKGGIIRQNVALKAGIGFKLVRSNGNLMHRNQYLGEGKEDFVLDKHSQNNHTLEDPPILNGDSSSSSDRPGVIAPRSQTWTIEERRSIEQKGTILEPGVKDGLDPDQGISGRSMGKFHLKGESARDIEATKDLANFLAPHNPGFLSIDAQGYRFRSQIAPDLGKTLKESGGLAIGVVRMPIKILRSSSMTLFPVWQLFVGEKEIAIVTLSLSGPGARIWLTEEKSTNVERALILLVAYAAHPFRSFYYMGGKFLSVAIVIALFSTSGWILWRLKWLARRKV